MINKSKFACYRSSNFNLWKEERGHRKAAKYHNIWALDPQFKSTWINQTVPQSSAVNHENTLNTYLL